MEGWTVEWGVVGGRAVLGFRLSLKDNSFPNNGEPTGLSLAVNYPFPLSRCQDHQMSVDSKIDNSPHLPESNI